MDQHCCHLVGKLAISLVPHRALPSLLSPRTNPGDEWVQTHEPGVQKAKKIPPMEKCTALGSVVSAFLVPLLIGVGLHLRAPAN